VGPLKTLGGLYGAAHSIADKRCAGSMPTSTSVSRRIAAAIRTTFGPSQSEPARMANPVIDQMAHRRRIHRALSDQMHRVVSQGG